MKWQHHRLFLLSTVLLGIILLWNYGSTGTTYDETADLRITRELKEGGSPFANIEIPSQTRLVYYLHAIAESISKKALVHYLISALSILLLMPLWYFFLYKHHSKRAANVILVLMLSSVPLITAGRHLLTHSNATFTLFFSLTFIQLYLFLSTQKTKHLLVSGIYWGFSIALSLLGVFAVLPFLLLVTFFRKQEGVNLKNLFIFAGAALLTFLASTIIYCDPVILQAAIKEALEGHEYTYWNYFNTGKTQAPYWFSLVLFTVKAHPVVVLILLYSCVVLGRSEILLHRFFAAVSIGVFLFLWVKSGVFHYDAPHHQVQFFPSVYAAISITVVDFLQKKQRLINAIAVVALLHQGIMMYPCYPNLLFYGAQYGERFIGQFYGPAVVHGLGVSELHKEINDLIAEESDTKILKQETSATRLSGEHLVNVAERDSHIVYPYAVASYLDLHHLQHHDSKIFAELLKNEYVPVKTFYYPYGVAMFTLYKHE
ncbi:MAG: glycosyltransferase family 39 protein [Bacteroidia bacterium]